MDMLAMFIHVVKIKNIHGLCNFKIYMYSNKHIDKLNVYFKLYTFCIDNRGNVITTVDMLYKHYCTMYTKLQKYCV